MHVYAFFFKGLCDIHSTFLQYFADCHKEKCFKQVETELQRDVASPINANDSCHLIKLKILGTTAVTSSIFELYIFENEASSQFGLEIKEIKRTVARDFTTVKASNVCRSVAADVALEDFRTFFHIHFSRTCCRRKHGNRALGYPASDEEAVAAHYEAIRGIVNEVSDTLETHTQKFAQMQRTIDTMSVELAKLKDAQKRTHEDDEARKRQRISE